MKDDAPNRNDWTPIPGRPCWYRDAQGNEHLSVVEVIAREGWEDTPELRAELIEFFTREMGARGMPVEARNLACSWCGGTLQACHGPTCDPDLRCLSCGAFFKEADL